MSAGTGLKRFIRDAGAAVLDLARRKTDPAEGDRQALAQSRRYWDDTLALTLGDLMRPGETKASGRVQFISLADFRNAIGPLWDEYRERIILIAETTLARMIGKGRTFIPFMPAKERPEEIDTWLLLCPDLAEDEAVAHADLIARRIGDKLMGANFGAHEPPLPTSATLDMTGVISADGNINFDALKAAVTRARAVQSTAATAQPASGNGERKRLHAHAALRTAWSAQTEIEDAFFLRPVAVTGEELVSAEGPAWPESVATKLCETAERLLADMGRATLRAKLALPLPYAMLYTPAALTLREAIAAMPKQLRLLHLRVEIVRIPAAVPSQQLAALREIFRPAVREVAFLVDAFAPCDAVFDLDNILVGTDFTAARGWDESDLRKALSTLRDGAVHCPTYVLGLRNRDHVRMALSMGIHEIGGQPVSSDVERLPDSLRMIQRAALMAH